MALLILNEHCVQISGCDLVTDKKRTRAVWPQETVGADTAKLVTDLSES